MPTAADGIALLRSQLGVEWNVIPYPESPLHPAAGFAVIIGTDNFVAVSIEDRSTEFAGITFGVLKNIQNERLEILTYCNSETANNPGQPIYLWGLRDAMLQLRSPMFLLAGDADLIRMRVETATTYGMEKRESWLRQGLVGDPFRTSEDDLDRLFSQAISATV